MKNMKFESEEEILIIDNRKLDLKNRITLPKDVLNIWKKAGDYESIQVLMKSNGDIILRPTKSIPINELWIYEDKKVFKTIKKGLQDIKAKRTVKVKDIDEFIEEL